jgi:anti-sigma B factor antagonist
MQEERPVTMTASSRQVNGVTIIDLCGSITIDEGSGLLRRTVQELAREGSNKVVLNLGGVSAVDSTGLGELVNAHTSLRHAGGELKLLNLTREVQELLEVTKLYTIFAVANTEDSAVSGFQS